jgi:homoserine dehydrogenase
MKKNIRVVPVAVMGAGKIGQGVLASLQRNTALFARRWGLSFDLELVLDSRGALFFGGSQQQQQQAQHCTNLALEWKAQGHSFSSHPVHGISSEQSQVPLQSLAERGGVLIDCTASDTSSLLLAHLSGGGRAVLANKKPLSSSIDVFKSLSQASFRSRLAFESACGAGTPFITSVSRMVDSGDSIARMITTQLTSQTRISELLTSASAKGFTEPDPRDDLSGMDVARKALILARLVGLDLEMGDVKVEPLYPASLASCSAAEFMRLYPSVDTFYQQKALAAENRGNTLRYVANVSSSGLEVWLLLRGRS